MLEIWRKINYLQITIIVRKPIFETFQSNIGTCVGKIVYPLRYTYSKRNVFNANYRLKNLRIPKIQSSISCSNIVENQFRFVLRVSFICPDDVRKFQVVMKNFRILRRHFLLWIIYENKRRTNTHPEFIMYFYYTTGVGKKKVVLWFFKHAPVRRSFAERELDSYSRPLRRRVSRNVRRRLLITLRKCSVNKMG